MGKNKQIFIGVIIVALALGFMLSPPILIAKMSPMFGQSYDTENDMNEQILSESLSTSRKRSVSPGIKHVYVLNFRFWQPLEIKPLQFHILEEEDLKIKNLIPFIYSIEVNAGDYDHVGYTIKRGSANRFYEFHIIGDF